MSDLIQEKKPVLSLSKGHFLSGWPMLIGWAAMFIFAIHASTHMVGAGDTWVAMACGRHFINHGVDTNEPFSANSHRQGPTAEEVKTWPVWAQWITDKVGLDTVKYWHPTGWVNQNWLTHVIFYWLTHLSPVADAKTLTFNSLVYLKFSIYILTVICVYYTGRLLKVNPALSAAFACAAMFIGRSYLDIRPAGFSNLLVALLILIVVLATYRNHLYIWLIVPMTIFWANVHGGYVYVFIMLTPIVVLRMLMLLSKRTTVGVFSILTWLALYIMMFKDTSRAPFPQPIPLSQDKLLIFIILLIIASIALMWFGRSTNPAGYYGFHIAASLLIFLLLLGLRFFPEKLDLMTDETKDYIYGVITSFVLAFFAAAGLGVIITLSKDRLVATSKRAVWHTAAAAIAALIASIIFNPFHLTNLTHTFVISVSEYAEGWRRVHEWWPAFKWDCPVGTSMPFMVMLIAGGGLAVIWLGSRWLAPRVLKGSREALESQQRFFNIGVKILGFAIAWLVCIVVMVSFSMTDASLAGFLLIGLFVGILWASVFVNVHFIYLVIIFSLFALATAGKDAPGYFNRYYFPFITVPCYVLMQAIGSLVSKRARFKAFNILFVAAGAAAAIIFSLVIVNPFKFQGPEWAGWLTPGTFFSRLYWVISNPKALWGLQRLWGPPYEANLDDLARAYTNIFPVLYILNAVSIVSWLLTGLVKALTEEAPNEKAGAGWKKQMKALVEGSTYQLPKIDLALITVSVLTMYMAYRSRRFIPIAGYMSCPILAMLAQQIIEGVSSAWNYYRRGRLATGAAPVWVRWFLTGMAVIVVCGLGGAWGAKFKRVYIDPWPTEPKLNSMFMRMTASSVKPFEACEFIRLNKLRGNMFNYWTEGGFIAWGQDPDPNTGRTPLQLFIDGRAQAAYNYGAYNLWNDLMSGGDIVKEMAHVAMIRRQEMRFTIEDYERIGVEMNKIMKQYKAWVILMPAGQFDTPFLKGIELNNDWRLAYVDDNQKLYVDITTQRGREIIEGIEDGRTRYPDEAGRNLMIANNALLFSQDPAVLTRGLECVIASYKESPTRMALIMIQYYDRFPLLKQKVEEFWRWVFKDFTDNEEKYLNSSGFHLRITSAMTAIEYLGLVAARSNDAAQLKQYKDERDKLQRLMEGFKGRGW